MKRILTALLLMVTAASASADEGMWMMGRIGKRLGRVMKDRGMEISIDEVCGDRGTPLKDAVVCFGGFCSGVVVSDEGLLLTNHHCGFESIQENSTVDHDYITNGFVAATKAEELPCHGLYVRFLVRTENVTRRMMRHVKPRMSEDERSAALDEEASKISDEVAAADSTLIGVVDSFYGGNEFWLSVYRDYRDVRMVFAPPASVGSYGGTTDNWEWPRHTGDFCVFRIYADSNNRPADYSKDNIPYRPERYAPVSLTGYSEGDFSMTLGYPGRTQRYLSSYGVEEMMECTNVASVEMLSLKLSLMKRAMESDKEIFIKYSSKYEQDANVAKMRDEQNKAIRRLGILRTKRDNEYLMARDTAVASLLKNLKESYERRRKMQRTMEYYCQAFFGGAELPVVAMNVINGDINSESDGYKLRRMYDNYDRKLDEQIFVAMAEEYRRKADGEYLPMFYQEADSLFGGDMKAYAEAVFSSSRFTSYESMMEAQRDTSFVAVDDPAANLSMELLFNYFVMGAEVSDETDAIERGERELAEVVRQRTYYSPTNYPDANMTMRLSYGTVRGYSPRDGVDYGFYTTARGILEKSRALSDQADFRIEPKLAALLADRSAYGRYSDEKGEMKVCFITDNDITGGNSGSPMFDSRGRLIGLAFDGNSEAMSSDVQYDADLQRCIGVDIRYVLYIIEKYGSAGHLIDELKLTSSE